LVPSHGLEPRTY